jgi:hypothetical protein
MNKGPLPGHAFANLLNEYYGHIMKAMDSNLSKEKRAYHLQIAQMSAPVLEIEANRIEHSIVHSLDQAKKSFEEESIISPQKSE